MAVVDDIFAVLERYYDGVPRVSATVEDFGTLTLFVGPPEGFPFYARPRLGAEQVDPADVERVLARQAELGVPRSLEWVAETTPALEATVAGAGLPIRRHPLMVLDAVPPAAPDLEVAVLGADDRDVPAAVAVAHLAFAEPGTGTGTAGAAELAAELARLDATPRVARTRRRIAQEQTVLAAAYDGPLVIASGQHNPLDGVSEIVGVGTLPSRRRRGAALAVTAALVADARARGVHTVFLSADDDAVARIYQRAGFRRIGTALVAEHED